jgi:hypothetical protein
MKYLEYKGIGTEEYIHNIRDNQKQKYIGYILIIS